MSGSVDNDRAVVTKKEFQPDLFSGDSDDADTLQIQPFTENALVSIANALGAWTVPEWSDREKSLCRKLSPVSSVLLDEIRQRILFGGDPLGDLFCKLRSPAERRQKGATFTPLPIVSAMIGWAASEKVTRVVDPGIGSGRFAISASKQFPAARILGIEIDPVPAMIARANFAVLGLANRSTVQLGDFRYIQLPHNGGRTLFIGNPPYVRHHQLDVEGKHWLTEEAKKLGYSASQLAGLHVHFFLATLIKSKPGDVGVFITASEWLDVNYGSLVREIFLEGLGGKRIYVVEPSAMPFPDADTTAAVTAFEVGTRPEKISLRRVETVAELANPIGERLIRRERLAAESRWSHLTRASRKPPAGYVELGELCRVHRGQVTGANKIWIEGPHSQELPESVFFPTVTKARELFSAGQVLVDSSTLRRVIDLPVELDNFDAATRKAIDRFLGAAKKLGIHEMYVAANRRAWWSVGLRTPAPILATYMARRPPAFVRNQAAARHINIAHGLYPREPLTEIVLAKLIAYLSRYTEVTSGRTYAGGLTKFEPREMERIFVPSPEMLITKELYG